MKRYIHPLLKKTLCLHTDGSVSFFKRTISNKFASIYIPQSDFISTNSIKK